MVCPVMCWNWKVNSCVDTGRAGFFACIAVCESYLSASWKLLFLYRGDCCICCSDDFLKKRGMCSRMNDVLRFHYFSVPFVLSTLPSFKYFTLPGIWYWSYVCFLLEWRREPLLTGTNRFNSIRLGTTRIGSCQVRHVAHSNLLILILFVNLIGSDLME